MHYNPIVRNFSRLRRVLMATLGLPRSAIRPSAKLADLVPREQRRRVWERFQREDMNVPELRLSTLEFTSAFAAMLACLGFGLVVWPTGWCTILLGAIGAGVATLCFHFRYTAAEIAPLLSVGELVLGMTSGRECRAAEYRLNRKEIFVKLRVILSDAANLDPDQITPETNLYDLFDDY